MRDMTEDTVDVRARLVARRRALGLTQEAIADAASLAQVTISGIERGARAISPARVAAIAAAYDLPPEDLAPLVTAPFVSTVAPLTPEIGAAGRALRVIREHARLDLTAMAARVGISHKSLEEVELGHDRISLATAAKIVDAYGVSVAVIAPLIAAAPLPLRVVPRETTGDGRRRTRLGARRVPGHLYDAMLLAGLPSSLERKAARWEATQGCAFLARVGEEARDAVG